MKRLAQRHLRVTLSKCQWGVREVIFLGFKFSQGKMATDPKKIEAIKKMMPYADANDKKQGIQQIQSFLGMTGFCRRFIRHYAEISRPLCALLKKDVPWKFESEDQSAWDSLRQMLVEAP